MKKFRTPIILSAVLVVNILTYFVYVYEITSKSSFIGFENYMRLMIKDSIFYKVMFNTHKIPTIAAILFSLVIFAVYYILRNKNIKRFKPLVYVVITLICYCFTGAYLSLLMALSFSKKPRLSYIMSFFFSYLTGHTAIYSAIVGMFVFWFLNYFIIERSVAKCNFRK